MILINNELSMAGENAMDNSEDQKNFEPGIKEKDTNANEPVTKLNTSNEIDTDDKKSDNEYKTDSECQIIDHIVSNEKDKDTEVLVNRQTDDKQSNDVPSALECTNRDKQNLGTRSPSVSSGKDLKINGEEIEGESVAKEGKRKRRISSITERESSEEKTEGVNKRKRSKSNEDKFCWRCHKESVDSQCTACPRAWHRRCMGGGPPPTAQNWICGECATILKAENAETRSPSMAQMSVEQLCTLLKHVVGRMHDYPGSEPFWKAVDLNEVPNYLDYVVKPMDLSLLESNVRAKLYGSTEAFMADAKWIQHNCIVFNTCGGVYADTSKLTNAARQIIKTARQEVSEIEACPDCYGHARNLPRPQPSWFIEPCRRPHPLVWAKLKGFPFWPAKAMSRVNGQGHVDVRFFGAHDRAWVPPRDLFLYSEDPPSPLPRKRKADMDSCVREVTRHCRKLELAFGEFKFAPPKIQYNPRDPTQIKLMLPNYDPLQFTSSLESPDSLSHKKAPVRKRTLIHKKRFSISDSIMNNTSDSANDSTTPRRDSGSDCEKYIEASRIPRSKSSLNKSNQPKSTLANKHTKLQNIRKNSPDNRDTLKAKKQIKRGRKSVISKKIDNSLANSTKTDDGIQREKNNQFVDRKSDGHSSSENDVSLDIRQSLKLNAPSESTIKPHNAQHNDTGSVVDSKAKFKNTSKINRTQLRVYKPKTRMVNQVNAERAKATAINQQKDSFEGLDNSNLTSDSTFTATNSTDNSFADSSGNANITTTATTLATISPVMVSKTTARPPIASIFLLTNGSPEPSQRFKSTEDCVIINDSPTAIKQEPNDHQQHTPPKKASKARKSFLNKPPVFPQILLQSPPKAPASPPDAMVYIPGLGTENEKDYLLLPPEAGPLSAQLYRGGQELAKQMTQLMEEALAEASQVKPNNGDDFDITQRATIHHLRLQIERMRWQHQQHLAELKHNTDLTLREMKASLEAERYRAIAEAKREAEEERLRSIEETKRKQWCALCGMEALFYCCWNTAYCDYPCQQTHWSIHMRTCAQNPPPNSNITASANVTQQQNGPNKQYGPAGNIYTLQNNEYSPNVPTTTPCPSIKAINI